MYIFKAYFRSFKSIYACIFCGIFRAMSRTFVLIIIYLNILIYIYIVTHYLTIWWFIPWHILSKNIKWFEFKKIPSTEVTFQLINFKKNNQLFVEKIQNSSKKIYNFFKIDYIVFDSSRKLLVQYYWSRFSRIEVRDILCNTKERISLERVISNYVFPITVDKNDRI